ncbi:MAG: VRR-NUC domain-containing protein [Bacteriovoracaceae bacterium]|nr:VRR-NUC domain-containing protein [Bacteriovoracaceae bacterium]
MAKRKRPNPRSITLDEGYYLTNFQKLLSFVEEVYIDILQKKERDFLKCFSHLSENGQKLYVRLIFRSKDFYRLSKLNYPEIDLEAAVNELQKHKLIEVNPLIEFPDFLGPFTVKEISDFLKASHPEITATGKRENLIQACQEFKEDCYQWTISKEKLLWPLFAEEVERFKLLFFGNLDLDMAQFILEDLGIMKFEKIRIDKKNRYFEGRKHLDEHYNWIILHSHLWEACDLKDLESATEIFKDILRISLRSSPLKRRLSRSYNLMAKLLESEREYEKALEIYQKSSIEPARERVARLYDKLEDPQKSLKQCELILKNPISESERFFALFFIEKMKKKLSLPYATKKRLPTPQEKILPLKWDKSGRVETQVLEHLKTEGFKGFYCENHYWTTLTALLFWEEFWASGPGVFYHPFEQAPRDFYSGEFYQRQSVAIEKKCLYWEEHENWESEIIDLYEEKSTTACRLTNWKKTSPADLKKMCKNIPKKDILQVCQQILKDPRQYGSGLPDLFLYRIKGDYILGEVKSPNDQIQSSQKRWIDLFSSWNIPFMIYRLKS